MANNILAIDAGFAQVKLEYPSKSISQITPSAVAEPLVNMSGFDGGQKMFVLDHGKFVFGEDALEKGSKPIQSLDDSWLLKYLPGMICSAAAKAGINLHDVNVLSTGLPIFAWRKYKDTLRNQLKTIRCNGQTYFFDRVEVRPQAVGALGLHSINADPDEDGLVLDVGGNTVLAVAYRKLKPIATNTRQYNQSGVLSLAHALAPMLSDINDGRKVTDIKAMEAIRERKYRNKDIGTQVDSAARSYCERLLSDLRSDYGEIIPELDRLVVVGGGAYLVGEALKREYKRTVVMREPEFANVRGYAYMSSIAV